MSDTYQPTQEQFISDVAKHRMRIVRDDGLYRHLEFRGEHGWHHWFEIVTWPGVLVIRGDMETWCFSRVDDMFTFFRGDGQRISPRYWQEKLQWGARDAAQRFSIDALKRDAIGRLDNYAISEKKRNEVTEELQSEVFEAYGDSDEYGALAALFEFSLHGVNFDSDDGPYGKEWSYHYIWCCRAIVWAIEQYDKGQV